MYTSVCMAKPYRGWHGRDRQIYAYLNLSFYLYTSMTHLIGLPGTPGPGTKSQKPDPRNLTHFLCIKTEGCRPPHILPPLPQGSLKQTHFDQQRLFFAAETNSPGQGLFSASERTRPATVCFWPSKQTRRGGVSELASFGLRNSPGHSLFSAAAAAAAVETNSSPPKQTHLVGVWFSLVFLPPPPPRPSTSAMEV